MKKMFITRVFNPAFAGLTLLLGGVLALQSAPATPDARLKWWQEARFGMFIHWGPVSIKGTEIGWSRGAQVPVEEYDKLYLQFNPVQFDANAWVRTAREAGMKYLVITSRHHDGFSLWNTRHSSYNIMNTPFKRDVLAELSKACREQGVKFCIYYSLCDWWHPDYPLGSPGGRSKKPSPNMERYVEYMKNQLAEIMVRYGPLGIVWFDGEWESPWTAERGEDMYRYLRAMQPSLIINNRVGKARKGMEGSSSRGLFAGDYDTPEQRIGRYQDTRPWESCITICQQWAWKPDDKLKSLPQCIQTLARCAGGDGNLLLNVGPMPDGRIEPRQVERLKEIGQWLNRNGEAIYGTRGGPYLPSTNIVSTRHGKYIYVHVFDWQGVEPVKLPPLPRKVKKASLLDGGLVEWSQNNSGITLQVPFVFRDKINTVIKLSLDGSAMDLATIPLAQAADVKKEQTKPKK